MANAVVRGDFRAPGRESAQPKLPIGPAGIDDPNASSGWVEAAPFRALAHRLIADTGWHWRVVAMATEVPAGTMRSLLGLGRAPRHERPRIRRSHALSLWERDAAFLRSRAERAELARTARTCLRALIAHGHDVATVAAITGLPAHLVVEIATGRRRQCTAMDTWRCRAAAQSAADQQHLVRLKNRSASRRLTALEQPGEGIAPADATAATRQLERAAVTRRACRDVERGTSMAGPLHRVA